MWTKASVAWALVICATGVLPTQGVVHSVSGGRDSLLTSVGHFAAYAVLAFLLARSAGDPRTGDPNAGDPRGGGRCAAGRRAGGRGAARRPLARAWLLAVSLGVVIEVVQGPLPYRDAQVWDVVVNGAGAALGVAVFTAAARAKARG